MRVSVLVHNLNRASILTRCLTSVAEQTYRPLEVIIADAGSTDESLSVIEQNLHNMLEKGIEPKLITCPLMGVAASRNYLAKKASGELLFFLDNDAIFASPNSIELVSKLFELDSRLAVVSARILSGDTNNIDPQTWVYRCSQKAWSGKQFYTFTFTGGGCCVRAIAFREAGGFWDHLKFSREEEELALKIIDNGWVLLYFPEIIVRHYSDERGRLKIINRRYLDLRNGLLIFWRRLPFPFSLLASLLRIFTVIIKSIVKDNGNSMNLISAIYDARKEWKEFKIKPIPVLYSTVYKYISLHFKK